MTIVVDDERWDVLEVEQQLAKTVAVVDARPRFITAESWMVEQMEDLKRRPEPKSVATGPNTWMPQGKAKRRRMGAGPVS
jgi:hypothetical protein